MQTPEQLDMGLEGQLQKTISTNENNSLHSAPELAELTKCVNIPRKEFCTKTKNNSLLYNCVKFDSTCKTALKN